MAKRQNFIVGSTNSVTETKTPTQLNTAWNEYEVLHAKDLDGVFNAVSDYSNDSSNEIANAILAITGAEPTGATETELAGALQQLREDIETSSLTFKGYVATTAPSSSTYALETGNIWINSASMPTTFPVAIAGVWDGSAWVSTTDTYTKKDFDFFRNINDGEGYYWFGGEWVVMSTDMSTSYFTLNQSTGKWEIKSDVNLPGNPTTTTPAVGDESTKIATTKFVKDSIASASDPFPVGAMVPTTWNQYKSLTPLAEGWLWCDGGTILKSNYPELFNVITYIYTPGGGYAWENGGNTYYINSWNPNVGDPIYDSNGDPITATVYSKSGNVLTDSDGVTYDRAETDDKPTFNLPDMTGRFVEGSSTASVYKEAGLPNITGSLNNAFRGVAAGGAFYTVSGGDNGYQWSMSGNRTDIRLDASRSSAVYKNDVTTVQPKSMTALFIIKYI